MKNNYILTICMLVIMLVVFTLVLPPGASTVKAAGNAQKWQFNDNASSLNATGAGVNSTKVANKQMSLDPPAGGSKAVTLPATNGAQMWWYMDQAANVEVNLGSAAWNAEAHVYNGSEQGEHGNLTIIAWKVGSDNTAIPLASGTEDITVNTTNTHYVVPLTASGQQTIPTGWTIGCSIEWSGANPISVGYNNTMGQTNDSWCETPTTDPGYPNPEASTYILVAIGAGAIILFIWMRNRRARAASPQG